jgi:hypothetical protein
MSQVFDIRQSESLDALDQIVNATHITADAILRAINSELTMPLRLTATASPNLAVHVGSLVVTNPQATQGRNRTIGPVGATVPIFTSGTVTFPASSGGTITVSPGTATAILTCGAGLYAYVVIALDQAGNLVPIPGAPAGSPTSAFVPLIPAGLFAIGFVLVHNTGGTIDNITNSSIYQMLSAQMTFQPILMVGMSAIATSNYTVGPNDTVVPVDTTAGAVTISLPTVTTNQKGRMIIIKDAGGQASQGGKAITVLPAGTDKIDTVAASIVMDVEFESLTFVCNGSDGWYMT